MAGAAGGRGALALQRGSVFLQKWESWEKWEYVTMSVCLCAVSLQVTKLCFTVSINAEILIQPSL